MAFFSIVIPLYNKENFIVKTINSVIQQTFTDFEIIIVNDGSTDKSETKVLDFNDSRIHYFSKKNEGVSSARNFGIEKATSNYICFLDADDYWHPNFLAEFHKVITENPNKKVFSCAIEIGIKNKIYPAKYSINSTEKTQIVNYFEASSKQSIISSSSVVFHKSVYESIGVFDPTIKTSEDTDFWIRVGIGYPIVFINTILARYVDSTYGLSRTKKDFSTSLNYNKFATLETTNLPLKRFLDLNRFSDAIKAKIYGDSMNFKTFYSAIKEENLSFKKRILLKMPRIMLLVLIQLQQIGAQIGLTKSVFK